jgi:hypothetical protein
MAWPELFGQPVGRDDVIGVHEQHRKHGPGPRAGHFKRLLAGRHFEGTKDTELHYASFHASPARGKQQRKLPRAYPGAGKPAVSR